MDYETERDDVVKDREYMLLGKSTWIDVRNLTVNVQRSETGITVDVWPRELMRGYAPIATLSVPFSEGSDDDN
jgi:hypothetical protein